MHFGLVVRLISLSINTHADRIIGFKSIAAYRSGLEIDTNVSKKDAEEGLNDVLRGIHVRISCPVM